MIALSDDRTLSSNRNKSKVRRPYPSDFAASLRSPPKVANQPQKKQRSFGHVPPD
jgi:hypothetical protein